MSSRCLQDMSWRRLEDVSSVWRRLGRWKIGTLKTCWRQTNVCWDSITLNAYQQERLVNTRKYQNKRLKLVLNGLRKQVNANTGLNMIVENHAFQIWNCRTWRSFTVFVSNDTRPSRIFDRLGEWWWFWSQVVISMLAFKVPLPLHLKSVDKTFALTRLTNFLPSWKDLNTIN